MQNKISITGKDFANNPSTAFAVIKIHTVIKSELLNADTRRSAIGFAEVPPLLSSQ